MTWTAAAACAGNTDLMFDRYRQPEAGTLCSLCPVAGICLWTAMAAEADEPHDYRYGMAGGLIPQRRAELGERLSAAEVDARLTDALAVHAGAVSRYRPLRRCAGCTTPISQRRAGRPRRWCSPSCAQRSTVDRAAAAESARRRSPASTEDERQRRRRANSARWAALPAAQRAALAAKRRRRRAERAAA